MELIPPPPADLQSLSSAELYELLAQELKLTTEKILRMAHIIAILDERGEDVSQIRIPILRWLRRVVDRTMLPGILVRFAGHTDVLNVACKLSFHEQKHLAEGGLVEMAIIDPRGTDVQNTDPAVMSRQQIRQVFGPDGIRTIAAQRTWLEDQRNKALVHQQQQEATVPLVVRLAPAELEKLRRACRQRGSDPQEMVVKLLLDAKIL